MSLVADYSDSSSSQTETSDSEADQVKQVKVEDKQTQLLPSAKFLLASSATKKVGEVLSNPFLDAEVAKTLLLEKHVAMVNPNEKLTEKNGRKICWNNRKGRCRFGSKCNYAHDSDLTVDVQSPAVTGNAKNINIPCSAISSKHDLTALADRCEQDETAAADNTKKRKRPGLANTIHPGKRVMKAYMQQNMRRP